MYIQWKLVPYDYKVIFYCITDKVAIMNLILYPWKQYKFKDFSKLYQKLQQI